MSLKSLLKSNGFLLISRTNYSFKLLKKYTRTLVFTNHPAGYHIKRSLGNRILFGVIGITGLLSYNGLSLANKTLCCEAPISPKPEQEQKDKKQVEKVVNLSNSVLLAEIWKNLQPDWAFVIFIILLSGCGAIVNIRIPMAIGKLVSSVQLGLASGSTIGSPALKYHALRLLGLFSFQSILTFCTIFSVTRLGERFSLRVKSDLLYSLLSQDMAFFDQRLTGDIITRLTVDLPEFKHNLKLVITQGLKSGAQIIGSVAAMIQISPSLSLTIAAFLPAFYSFMLAYGFHLRRVSKNSKLLEAKSSSVAQETLANIRTVRAFAGEEHELEKYMAASRATSSSLSILGTHLGVFAGITSFSVGGLILAILWIGGDQVVKGNLQAGSLMSFLVASQTSQKSLTGLGKLLGETIKALGSASRVYEYILTVPTIPLVGGIRPALVSGEIEFRNVNFSYPARKEQLVLNDFNLKIAPNSMVAIVGASGSGKSTITQLLERFYSVDSGQIFLDKHDITALDPLFLRSNIGYINQEPTLFAASVKDNIRYGAPLATDAQVEEASIAANCHEFISRFPNGYNQLIGERGSTLSGGQRQRIAIARALLKNPKILILDEATSNLDSNSERLVQDALSRSMVGRTVIVIAHRLSTISGANHIVVLKPGGILEQGTHKELIKKRGNYYSMFGSALN